MGHDVCMPFDWAHLATEIRAAREDLDLTQAELAVRARVSEETIKNLEGRRKGFTRWPASAERVEQALEKPGGWARATARHEPTRRRETEDPRQVTDGSRGGSAGAGMAEPLPLPVELALGEGRLLDYEVVSFDVEGEPVTIVTIARTSVTTDEHKKAILRAQLEALGRIKGHIRREAEAAAIDDRLTPDG